MCDFRRILISLRAANYRAYLVALAIQAGGSPLEPMAFQPGLCGDDRAMEKSMPICPLAVTTAPQLDVGTGDFGLEIGITWSNL
jgi:hypothetical protein